MLDPRINRPAIEYHHAHRQEIDPDAVPVPGWPADPAEWWARVEAAATERREFPRPEAAGMAVTWNMGRIDDNALYALLMSVGMTNVGGGSFIASGVWEDLRQRFAERYLEWRAEHHQRAVRRAQREAMQGFLRAVDEHVRGGWHLVEGGLRACGGAPVEGDPITNDVVLVTCIRCLDALGAAGRILDLVRVKNPERGTAAPREGKPQDFSGSAWPDAYKTQTGWKEAGRRLKRGAQVAATGRWKPHWGRRHETLRLYHEVDTEPMFEVIVRGAPRPAPMPEGVPDLSDFIRELAR